MSSYPAERPEAGNFDICGPLPGPGITVLEASAGTGKTYTIAALVTRMVAEAEARLSEILVVTFTRMATGELRERTRQSLADAERALSAVLGGSPPPAHGPLLGLLASGGAEEVDRRRQRLADALAGFDAATITTTHGFCHAMLETLGARGEVAPGAALLEDAADLVEEVVDDLFVRHGVRRGAVPFPRSVAVQAGGTAVANPGTPLGPPADAEDDSPAGLRRRLADATRREVDRRLLDANLLTYDGLLVRLSTALGRPGRGEAACARLRQRYRVVLVDEFQDTDLVQWDVVRRAFADGRTTVVLIGDPKQAIYAFRGADVYAYLEAARSAGPGRRFTLEQNWRSDRDLLDAYNALLSPLQLGHPDIRYRLAQATPAHERPGLQGAPCPAPVRVRVVDRRARGVPRTTSAGLVQAQGGRKLIADDLAHDVVALLGSGAQLVAWGPDGQARSGPRPVGPGDIGVLVRTNRQAALVQAALRSLGVPAVVAGADSVLLAPAARHWLNLLRALEEPGSRAPAVAVALGPFVGMNASQVAMAGEQQWEQLHEMLHRWSAQARRDGIASLYAHLCVSEELPARLLAQVDGERQLTDLGHVAELLHAQAQAGQLGLAALGAWLGRRTTGPEGDGTDAEQRGRRLDSGSEAVQLLTVHRAKGLEFPIVYCPYLWDSPRQGRPGGPVVFHDPDNGLARTLDVGGDDGPLYQRHYAQYRSEARGEDLRHLYVALTRARHQVVLWWAGAQDAQHSALGRLLLRRDASTGAVAPNGTPSAPSDEHVRKAVAALAGQARGLISLEVCRPLGPLSPPGQAQARPAPELAGPFGGPSSGPCTGLSSGPSSGPSRGAGGRDAERVELEVATFGRRLDYRWRRSSYTSITAASHAERLSPGVVSSEPEEVGTVDEPVEPVPPAPLAGGPAPVPEGHRASLLASMPAGADVGTFVHRALERADFDAPDLRPHLLEVLGRPELAYPGPPEVLPDVAEGLAAAIETPLGPLAGGSRLRDLHRGDRLDELSFELPVAGGERPTGEVALASIARAWLDHVGPGEPLSGYGHRLLSPALAPVLRGYLTGSLDLVARLDGSDGPRYFVADYKTNWLAPPGEPLSTWHYRRSALAVEMEAAHYPLQALIYLVALHRYLRWRLEGYQPARHLGGVLYLFVRGMSPAAAAEETTVPGVFDWRPPPGLVTAVSDLLARGS